MFWFWRGSVAVWRLGQARACDAICSRVAVTHLPLAKVGSSGAEFGVGGMVERWGPLEDRDIVLLLAALLGVLAVIGAVYLVVGL